MGHFTMMLAFFLLYTNRVNHISIHHVHSLRSFYVVITFCFNFIVFPPNDMKCELETGKIDQTKIQGEKYGTEDQNNQYPRDRNFVRKRNGVKNPFDKPIRIICKLPINFFLN